MIITLLRHTEVETDFIGKYNGHNNIGLSPQGKKDALQLAKYFENKHFDKVLCSDLRRTRETLAPFAQQKQANYTSALREKSWGIHEGLGFDEIVTRYNIEYKNFQQWIEALDGEDYKVYEHRIEKFFQELFKEKELQDVLIITHAGVIRTLIKLTCKLSLEESFAYPIPYGGAIVFDTRKQTFLTKEILPLRK